MKTDFLASTNHFPPFLRQQSTAASGSSFFFNQNIFFSKSFIPASKNEFFVYWKQYCFIPRFFLVKGNITEIQGKSNFKEEPYFCQWRPLSFDFSRYFLKWKPCFRIIKAYFSVSFTRLLQTNFLPTERIFFWLELFCFYQKSLVIKR